MYIINPFKAQINLNYIKISSYRPVNIRRLYYKDHSDNVVKVTNHCLC
jgi:hypothetical protein